MIINWCLFPAQNTNLASHTYIESFTKSILLPFIRGYPGRKAFACPSLIQIGHRWDSNLQKNKKGKRAGDDGKRKGLVPRCLQGGKTFCASFCASFIAGSRRAFLCVDCVRQLSKTRSKTEWNAQGVNVCSSKSLFTFVWFLFFVTWKLLWTRNNQC